MFKKMLISLALLYSYLSGETLNIFVAASAKNALSEIITTFENTHSDTKIVATYGASGKAYAQLQNGLEYELFFSADNTYTQKIVDDKLAISEPLVYARGAVALYSLDESLVKKGIESLKSAKHISIANPKLAPYGVSALEILKNYNLDLEDKLVLGDNIAQSVLFVDSGSAEVGLVAYSLLKGVKDESKYMLIDESKYKLLEQSFVITKYAKNEALAKEFALFVTSSKAKEIFAKYGFR